MLILWKDHRQPEGVLDVYLVHASSKFSGSIMNFLECLSCTDEYEKDPYLLATNEGSAVAIKYLHRTGYKQPPVPNWRESRVFKAATDPNEQKLAEDLLDSGLEVTEPDELGNRLIHELLRWETALNKSKVIGSNVNDKENNSSEKRSESKDSDQLSVATSQTPSIVAKKSERSLNDGCGLHDNLSLPVSILLEKGARVWHKDSSGRTALAEAVAWGGINRIRLLIAMGGGSVRSALDALVVAAERGATDIVEHLLRFETPKYNNLHSWKRSQSWLDQEQEWYGQSNSHRNAAMTAAIRGGHKETIKALLNRNINATARHVNIASKMGNSRIVELLIEHGTQVSKTDRDKWSYIERCGPRENMRILGSTKVNKGKVGVLGAWAHTANSCHSNDTDTDNGCFLHENTLWKRLEDGMMKTDLLLSMGQKKLGKANNRKKSQITRIDWEEAQAEHLREWKRVKGESQSDNKSSVGAATNRVNSRMKLLEERVKAIKVDQELKKVKFFSSKPIWEADGELAWAGNENLSGGCEYESEEDDESSIDQTEHYFSAHESLPGDYKNGVAISSQSQKTPYIPVEDTNASISDEQISENDSSCIESEQEGEKLPKVVIENMSQEQLDIAKKARTKQMNSSWRIMHAILCNDIRQVEHMIRMALEENDLESQCSLGTDAPEPEPVSSFGSVSNRSLMIDSVLMGNSPLMKASGMGNNDAVSALVAAGASVNKCTDSGRSALVCAASSGHLDTMKLLLKLGADPNLRQGTWSSVLYRIIRWNDDRALSILIEGGVNVNPVTPPKMLSPLIVALKGSNTNVIKLLLEAGADPNATDSYGRNCLHRACARGTPELVDLVLKYGGIVQTIDKMGRSPIFSAVFSRNPEVVTKVMKAGARTRTRDIYDKIPGDYAKKRRCRSVSNALRGHTSHFN